MTIQHCKNCGTDGSGNYCSHCGQSYKTSRISLPVLLHDVFHFFTHLEKGFGYTLKQLVVAPGTMQRRYLEGYRGRHQKPFSMFFICASIAALGRYLIFEALIKYYHLPDGGDAHFYHQYWVFLFIVLMPFIALMNWLLFYNEKYYYAEMLVLSLYNLSVLLIGVLLITALHLINPYWNTDYIDLGFALLYNIVTFYRFFSRSNHWVVIIKTIIATALFFQLVQVSEDLVKGLVR
ncbi:MAG: DUF3667 domain-containing protein [Chitinophagaceae bacterium]|nr:DUF3667 domain-containing protein [Chitinophagaceae bacterium]